MKAGDLCLVRVTVPEWQGSTKTGEKVRWIPAVIDHTIPHFAAVILENGERWAVHESDVDLAVETSGGATRFQSGRVLMEGATTVEPSDGLEGNDVANDGG